MRSEMEDEGLRDGGLKGEGVETQLPLKICHKSIIIIFFLFIYDMCTQFLQYFYNKF